ncbi:hypothetical protein V6N13_010600 [Hibiscus sabdariffa]
MANKAYSRMVMDAWMDTIVDESGIVGSQFSSFFVDQATAWFRVKLNIDGAISLIDGVVVVDGVIRSDSGELLGGFARSIGRCPVYVSRAFSGVAEANLVSSIRGQPLEQKRFEEVPEIVRELLLYDIMSN